MIPNIKYQRINGKNWSNFIIVKFQSFDFLKEPYFCRIDSGPIWKCVHNFFLAKSLQKSCFNVHEKLQRNPSVGRDLKNFIFRPYGFENLGFLENAPRDAMMSKTQWVYYRDLHCCMKCPQIVNCFWITANFYQNLLYIFLSWLKIQYPWFFTFWYEFCSTKI